MEILQGVTLTDLREAQRTYSLAHQDREIEEGVAVGDRPCQRRGCADDSEAKDELTESTETAGISLKWSKKDEVKKENKNVFSVGNWVFCCRKNCFLYKIVFILKYSHSCMQEGNLESRLERLTGSPDLSYLSVSESGDLLRPNFFKGKTFTFKFI